MTEQKTEKHCVHSGSTSAFGDSHTNYKQYLRSLFGEASAEYFLSPSSPPESCPAWYTEMKEGMRDHMSAEAFWDALRERSARILREMETSPCKQAERVPADWRSLMRQDHLRHLSGVRFMFHSAQRNRAFSDLLLNGRTPSLHLDQDMSEGPSKYTAGKSKQLTE